MFLVTLIMYIHFHLCGGTTLEYEEVKPGSHGKSERRSQSQLILDILRAVPIEEIASVDQVAKTVGARWGTTSKYLELIALIQKSPTLRVYTVKGQNSYFFRREPGTILEELRG